MQPQGKKEKKNPKKQNHNDLQTNFYILWTTFTLFAAPIKGL